jgi:hypothetical protein
MISLSFIFVVVWISVLLHPFHSFSLPYSEYEALQALYNSTDGLYWAWVEPYSQHGYPWDFTVTENPCDPSHRWQGLNCTSDCNIASCHIEAVSLISHNLFGNISS